MTMTTTTATERKRNILAGQADLITLVDNGGLAHGEIIDWAIELGYHIDPDDNLGQRLDGACAFLNRLGIY